MTDSFAGWTRIDSLDEQAIRAACAIVAIVDEKGACSLLATTANARAFWLKRKLQVDVAATTPIVYSNYVDSMFDAELAFLTTARKALPDSYQSLIAPWQAWYLRLDPERGTWANATVSEAMQPLRKQVAFGPVQDKRTVSKLGELLDDLFDLCRYPAELAKTPNARPCPYKEMGRCPAPCDGSEPWSAFLERFQRASEALRSIQDLQRAVEKRTRMAASINDFERAAHLQSITKRLDGRLGKKLAHLAHAHAFAQVALVPRARHHKMIYLCRPDGIHPVAELEPNPTIESCQAAIESIASVPAQRSDWQPSCEQTEAMNFVTHRLFLARRTELFLTLEDAINPATLRKAACRTTKPESDD